MRFKNLLTSSSILSVPGLISIFISLLAIPIHLKYAGPENYGNYIIFHFILLISINFNFGIGKSVTISINNFINKKKEIGYDGKITWDENMPIGPNRRNVSIELARKKLNFNPLVSLEEGVKKTVDWYLNSKNL